MPLITEATPQDQYSGPIANSGTPQIGADRPIDRLRPKSELHQNVLQRLLDMKKMSERQMSAFYDRWRAAELQYQAYLKTETFEQLKKAVAKNGTPPELITITIPYTYASVQTICTYLLHTFGGQNPMFQVGSRSGERTRTAQNLETVLQYNGDHERIIGKLWQFFHDGECYGLQALRCTWKVEQRVRTVWKPTNVLPIFGRGAPQMQPQKETVVSFEGNELNNIDPFRFFPDPRVPLKEVSKRGEFVFWEEYEGKHSLKKAEKAGLIKYVDDIPAAPRRNTTDSQRGRLAASGTNPGLDPYERERGYIIMQGTVDLCPDEWGLGDNENYEKWIFSVANDGQIIQAEPLDLDHGLHPVIVGEPYSTGYEFGSMSVTDMLGPMQDSLSWMFNSHLFNVRSALNNTFLVNPQMVDMEDLKKPGPGRVIKLKPAAFGQDVKNAFYQVPIADVTAQHLQDMGVMQRFGDLVSATNDNLRGVINSVGRKSATEIRQTGEAGASRLAAHARLVSAQSISPLAEMESINLQQNMSQDVWLRIVGAEDAQAGPVRIGPQDISGDFYFPIHDGTLPLDRVALLDVWREIFMAIIQNPGLSQIFDAVGIFQYIAELGGAKNLSTFKVQTASNQAVAGAVQTGNMIPTGQAAAALPRPTP
jgi:hypothetical protein